MNRKTTHELREAGIQGCKTHSPEHYKSKEGELQPLDLIASLGLLEDFCLASIIKYTPRYKKTGQQKDLAKIADYAHILYGYNRET